MGEDGGEEDVWKEGEREQAEERDRLLPWKHQAEFHILNGNHGNNYRADRQAVFWKDGEGERENAGEEERSCDTGEKREVKTVGWGSGGVMSLMSSTKNKMQNKILFG